MRTGGAIYPGLIDLHGHIAYNGLPLWSPPGRIKPYTSRYQWPGDQSYEGMISDPANALGALAGKAHLKYLETKAVVGGTTAIQGTAKTGRPYEGWLVRNIEYETFQTKKKTVYVSALPLRDEDAYKSQAQHLKDKLAFVYHLSEGTDPKLISEYTTMNTEHCLAQGLAAIHCTALEKANYDEWAPLGGAVVWSPFSNLWLYARHDRRARRPCCRRAHLPRRRLVAFGLEEPPRRAEGRRHVEPHAPQRRADGPGDLRDGHLQPGRRASTGATRSGA